MWGSPLSVVRVLDVRDIKYQCSSMQFTLRMVWFATWSRKCRPGLGQLNLFSSTLGMVCSGIQMIQTEYSVGIGWGICGSCLYTFKNMQKKGSSCMSGLKGTPKGTQKRKKGKPYLKLMASAHLNMDYGVPVLGDRPSVMQVSWAASTFKAASYYSVHPLICQLLISICNTFVLVKQRPRLSLGIVCWIIHVSRLIRHTNVSNVISILESTVQYTLTMKHDDLS